MAGRSAWAGAISLGPLVNIPVKLYSVTNKTAPSFKGLCPCHQEPIKAPKTCATTGDVVDAVDVLKGEEVSKGKFVVIPPDALATITEQERTTVLEPKLLTAVSGFPFDLSTAHYSLVADDGPNAEQGVQILWNGLRANGWVMLSEVSLRAGSPDQLVAIYAGDDGLYVNSLPWHTALKDAPVIVPEANEQMGDVFAQYAQMNDIPVGEFDHASFESGYLGRRQAAVAAALAGEPIPTRDAGGDEKPVVPDLMAALTASLAAAKPKPKAKGKAPLKAVA